MLTSQPTDVMADQAEGTRPAPTEGTVIAGKYRLAEILGEGATGTVWRAIHVGLERPIAIKLLHPQIAARDEAYVRFLREARVASSLDHESSVAVLDFGQDAGVLYLVMELVTGKSLRVRLHEGRLTLEDAVAIVRQVAAALGAAHRIRLVHRDIKPENVILFANGARAKVVDFGLAFIADPDEPSSMGRLTHDGTVVGTPAYMSPEQVRGGSIGPSSDIYSLGCMFYELIAGRPPFIGALGEVFTRHAYTPPIPLRQLTLPELPPIEIDELVQAMLSKSPSSRPTASRISAVLARYSAVDDSRAGRTSSPVIERAQRAVGSGTEHEREETADKLFALGVLGELPSELELALVASGIEIVRWTPGSPRTEDIVWASGASKATLVELVAAGKQVVTDVDAGDAAALPRLINVGVADAIVRPHCADDLVRRLWRVHRLRLAVQ